MGTTIAFRLVGYFSDMHQESVATSFDWILIAAGLVPLAGMALVLVLVSEYARYRTGEGAAD